MTNTNFAKKGDANAKDRYEKDLGQLPDIEPRPFRTTEVAALMDSMRHLQRTTDRLGSALIFLTITLVVLGVADHWTAIQTALGGFDHWRQQWLH